MKLSQPKFSFFDSAELVNVDDWNKVTDKKAIYLSLNYLRALEDALKDEMAFRYILIYNDELTPIAAVYVQTVHILDQGNKYEEIICTVGDTIKNKLLKSIDARILVCGNMFASGENGLAYTEDINSDEAYALAAEGMKRIIQDKDKNGQISFSLFKEYWPSTFEESDKLKKSKYRDFMIDVNMVMNIPSSWKKWEDYMHVLTSKFRTRVNSVFKRSESLIIRNLSSKEIEIHQSRIEELYHAVISKADYKFAQLNGQSFVNFKKKLGKRFLLKGYFLNNEMIGFSSVFHYYKIMDALYVGLDYQHNKKYALYQRMLYDFVAESIKLKAQELRLGRTAELIKSSVGALPVNMKLYAKHRNTISNKLLGPLISNISPSKFELRTPFKKSLYK